MPVRAETLDADFLVVGSGFGGAVSALRLAEKGYSVVVLERGRRWRTDDFPPTNWSLRRYLWAPLLGLRGIQALTPLRHALVLHGVGVGGGSLVYANVLAEPGPGVLEAPEWGGVDWRARLRPHFDEARRMLGAVPCEGMGRSDELLAEVATELGLEGRLSPHHVGVYFGAPGETVPDPYFGGDGPERTGCTRCAACMVGCRVGAKNTLDKNYLWLAEQRGVRIVPETEAVAIRDVGDGYEVESRSTAGLRRGARVWRAREVVVAAGVLGSVRLLAESRARGGLPELSPRLGDFVRTNSEAILLAESHRGGLDLADHVAITSGIQADTDTHVEMVRFNRGSDALFWLAFPLVEAEGRLPRALRAVLALLRRPHHLVRALVPWGRAGKAALVLGMQAARGHFSLRLRTGPGPKLRSEAPPGAPAPVLDVPVVRRITESMARRLGGRASMTLPAALAGAPTTAHVLGGCRMGEAPDEAVVDHGGRVFGHPGLYVVDGSILPGNVGVNPALTITALAEHAMSQVAPRS